MAAEILYPLDAGTRPRDDREIDTVHRIKARRVEDVCGVVRGVAQNCLTEAGRELCPIVEAMSQTARSICS